MTPALRGRIKIIAFERGTTVADMLRELLEREFEKPIGTTDMIPINHRQIGAIVAMVFAVGLIVVALVYRPSPKIIYNPSSSAPRGWYAVKSPTELHRGDFALVGLPAPIAQLADERRYLPRTVPLLKQVGAVAGDRVCERQGVVDINGVPTAQSLERDGQGDRSVTWSDCRRLEDQLNCSFLD